MLGWSLLMSSRTSLTMSLAVAATMLAATLFAATGAQAKYTAIDAVTTIEFSGYCDSQNVVGEECNLTHTLPYTVIFGTGETDQLLLRDDGVLDFVGAPLVSPPSPTELFDVLATVDTGLPGPGTTPQVATLEFQGQAILATWFTCALPSTSCFQDQHTALLTPVADGFNITYTGGGTGPSFLAAAFGPARAVPEPTAWVLMILGFGAAGAALRRRGLRVA